MKVLTVPDTTPPFALSPTFGTSEVTVTPATPGGGGAGVPLSRARYVDAATSLAPADQTGAATAPFSTITAAVAALQAAFGTEDTAVLVVAGDYSTEPAIALGHTSVVGLVPGDSVSVSLPALTIGGGAEDSANVYLANVDAQQGVGGAGNLFVSFCQLGTITGGADITVQLESSAASGTFSGEQLIAHNSSVGYTTVALAGDPIEMRDCVWQISTVTFGAPGGIIQLDAFTAFYFHQAQPDVTNGQMFVAADLGTAELTVAVPTLAAGTLGYATVDVTGTEFENQLSAFDVVVANPVNDLAAAGLGNGGYINCRVSATNTIKLAFVGALAGGNSAFYFARCGRVIPPPS